MMNFYGWVSKHLRGRKGQQGFTLIELLVVVTILGILAGIVTLSLVGLTTHANVQACQSEYRTVQAALDAYMANNNLSSTGLSASQGVYTNDMSGGVIGSKTGTVKLYVTSPSDISPNYTRNGVTQFYYEWDTSGRITGVSSGNGIGSDASGAAVSGCAPK
jgi:prepilin-type N-terminal cleavage/methylation domain-containing protein